MSRSSAIRLGLLALLWGSSFLWIKLALRGFTPVQITLVRLALGSLVLIPIALNRGLRFPTGRTVWLHLFVAALVANAIPYTLFGIAEKSVGSNVAGVINATAPLWTVLIAYLAGTDRHINAWRGLGLAAGFAGTVLIFTPWESAGEIASWGGLACLAASLSYGVSYVYMGRFLIPRGIPPIMLSASQLAAATAILALALPFGGLTGPTWRTDAVVSLLILGALGTGAAYVLNYRLIGDIGPTAASTVSYLLPVVAVILGVLVVDERVTAWMVAGMLLVLAGVFLVQRVGAPPKPAPAAPVGERQ